MYNCENTTIPSSKFKELELNLDTLINDISNNNFYNTDINYKSNYFKRTNKELFKYDKKSTLLIYDTSNINNLLINSYNNNYFYGIFKGDPDLYYEEESLINIDDLSYINTTIISDISNNINNYSLIFDNNGIKTSSKLEINNNFILKLISLRINDGIINLRLKTNDWTYFNISENELLSNFKFDFTKYSYNSPNNKYIKYNLPISSVSFKLLPNKTSDSTYYKFTLEFTYNETIIDKNEIGEIFATYFYSTDISNNLRYKTLSKQLNSYYLSDISYNYNTTYSTIFKFNNDTSLNIDGSYNSQYLSTLYFNDLSLNTNILKNISIQDNIYTIESNLFRDNNTLVSIDISNNNLINKIKDNTFRNCTSLTSIILSKNIISLGKNSFYNDTSLNSIYFQLEDSLISSLIDKCFYNCVV